MTEQVPWEEDDGTWCLVWITVQSTLLGASQGAQLIGLLSAKGEQGRARSKHLFPVGWKPFSSYEDREGIIFSVS